MNPTVQTVAIAAISLQVQTPNHQHFFIGEEALDVADWTSMMNWNQKNKTVF